ncbi:MAG: hypothetical protein ACMXYK_00635 [Candidatus Woesearchaeota archaeon]
MKLIMVFLSIVLLVLTACSSEYPANPSSPGVAGNYYRAIGPWATAPVRFISQFDFSLDDPTLIIEADDDYVFNTYYVWNNADQEWDSHIFSQEGAWSQGYVLAERPFHGNDLKHYADSNGEIYTVVYTCSRISQGNFDCHSNRWQLDIQQVPGLNYIPVQIEFNKDSGLKSNEILDIKFTVADWATSVVDIYLMEGESGYTLEQDKVISGTSAMQLPLYLFVEETNTFRLVVCSAGELCVEGLSANEREFHVEFVDQPVLPSGPTADFYETLLLEQNGEISITLAVGDGIIIDFYGTDSMIFEVLQFLEGGMFEGIEEDSIYVAFDESPFVLPVGAQTDLGIFIIDIQEAGSQSYTFTIQDMSSEMHTGTGDFQGEVAVIGSDDELTIQFSSPGDTRAIRHESNDQVFVLTYIDILYTDDYEDLEEDVAYFTINEEAAFFNEEEPVLISEVIVAYPYQVEENNVIMIFFELPTE